MADEEVRAAVWRDPGDRADADGARELRQPEPCAEEPGMQPAGAEGEPLILESRAGSWERVLRSVRADKQPNLSFQSDITAK